MQRVCALFKDYPDLVDGFVAFLPPECRIRGQFSIDSLPLRAARRSNVPLQEVSTSSGSESIIRNSFTDQVHGLLVAHVL